MESKQRQGIDHLLSDDNLTALIEYALQNSVNTVTALNLIVSEWAEKRKIGRLKATDEATALREIKSRLDNLEKYMSQFELVPDETFSAPSE